MKCKVALERLSPLLDEALQEDEARVVSGHLTSVPAAAESTSG